MSKGTARHGVIRPGRIELDVRQQQRVVGGPGYWYIIEVPLIRNLTAAHQVDKRDVVAGMNQNVLRFGDRLGRTRLDFDCPNIGAISLWPFDPALVNLQRKIRISLIYG